MNGLENACAAPALRRRGRPAANAPDLLDEEQLLAAAFSMFAERGYEAATVRDLSRQLGVSHNLLNVRFGRKEDLWKAAVDWRFSDASRLVEPVFDSDAPADTRLRELVLRFCQWTLVNSDIVAISQAEATTEGWRIDYIYSRFTGPFEQRLDALMTEVRQTRAMSDLSAGALLAIMVHGIGMYFAAAPMRTRLEAGRTIPDPQEHAQMFAGFLIGGLFGGQAEDMSSLQF